MRGPPAQRGSEPVGVANLIRWSDKISSLTLRPIERRVPSLGTRTSNAVWGELMIPLLVEYVHVSGYLILA